MAKKHPYSHSVIEHHKDGSHTLHHVHESNNFAGPAQGKGDVRGAAGDHDAMMDHMMDHTSEMNEGEGMDAAGKSLTSPVVVGGSMASKAPKV